MGIGAATARALATFPVRLALLLRLYLCRTWFTFLGDSSIAE